MVDTFCKLSRPDRCRAATFGRAFRCVGTKTGIPKAGGTLEHGSARKSSRANRGPARARRDVENHPDCPINVYSQIINTPIRLVVMANRRRVARSYPRWAGPKRLACEKCYHRFVTARPGSRALGHLMKGGRHGFGKTGSGCRVSSND